MLKQRTFSLSEDAIIHQFVPDVIRHSMLLSFLAAENGMTSLEPENIYSSKANFF